MNKLNISLLNLIQWLGSRVFLIYGVVFIFCLTCVDLKTLDMRVKTRRLNDAIPDFSGMIIFSKDQNSKRDVDWTPYKKYFELVLSYMPDDVTTKPLLGYVDYYSGREQQAIDLFKGSAVFNGHDLFWPNYDLGVLYYKKNKWALAGEYFLKAITASPQLTVILMQNSTVYRQIFASPYFKYSLSDEIMEAQGKAYILLLSSLRYMGQYEKMVIISNAAIANQNLSYKDAFYFYAGLGFYEMGHLEKAFLFFQKALTLEKDNPDIYYYLASIYQKAGHLEQARYYLQISYVLHQKNDPRFPYDRSLDLSFL